MTGKEPKPLSRQIQVLTLGAALALSAGAMSLGGGARSPLAAAASPGVDDRGVFILSLAGRQIGTENFSIRSSRDQIEAKAQIQLRLGQDGKTVELKVFPDLLMNSRFEPLTYSWSQRGAQSSELTIDFRNSPAKCRYRTVTGQEDKRDFDLPRDVMVLDDNVLHHYELVVSRLNLPAGGQQTFKAFVPQEALPGVLTVEEVPGSSPGAGEHTERLRHLRVTTELTRIDLWVDEQNRLQRVSNPETQFDAVRKR